MAIGGGTLGGVGGGAYMGPLGAAAGNYIGGGQAGSDLSGLGNQIGKVTNKLDPKLNTSTLNPAQPIQPVTMGQVNAANSGVGNSIASQQALLAALQGQGGLGNQSMVFGQGNALAGQLGGAGGIQAQMGGIQGLQNVLAQQQAIANGQGPNPAQAMLNQSTGQNVANQAALMAGQRGAGANVGLMARQAAQQGAATQQQAAGQAATMQAQQQLGALSGMAGTNQALAGIGQGLTAQQQAQLGMNAGIAGNQVGNQIGVQGQNVQGNLGNAGQQLGAMGQYNANDVAAQNALLGATSNQNITAMQGRQGLVGGLLNGVGGVLGSAFGGENEGGARGGMVRMADGGMADDSAIAAPALSAPMQQGPQSSFAQYLNSSASSQGPAKPAGANDAKDMGAIASIFAAKGGMSGDYRSGGPVKAQTPAQKPVKKGNSYDNDRVPAMLSAGEIVIPRSVIQGKDPARGAAEFVRAVMAKRGKAS